MDARPPPWLLELRNSLSGGRSSEKATNSAGPSTRWDMAPGKLAYWDSNSTQICTHNVPTQRHTTKVWDTTSIPGNKSRIHSCSRKNSSMDVYADTLAIHINFEGINTQKHCWKLHHGWKRIYWHCLWSCPRCRKWPKLWSLGSNEGQCRLRVQRHVCDCKVSPLKASIQW